MAYPGDIMGRRLQQRQSDAGAIFKTAPAGTTPKRCLNCSDPQSKRQERRRHPFAPGGIFSPASRNDATTHGDCASHRHLECLKMAPGMPSETPENGTWDAVWNA